MINGYLKMTSRLNLIADTDGNEYIKDSDPMYGSGLYLTPLSVEITANRSEDEPDRLIRLNDFLGFMQGAIMYGLYMDKYLKSEVHHYEIANRVARVHDHKGICFVVWRTKPTQIEIHAANLGWSHFDGGDGPAQFYLSGIHVNWIKGTNDYYDVDAVVSLSNGEWVE